MSSKNYSRIESVEQLRRLLGQPAPLVCQKLADRLTPATRPFIERSPFVLLATFDRSGHCDLSPRGDPAGFVQILDERRLFVPERPGNRLADTLRNILDCGRLGMLFLLPGVGDCLRVNGSAWLSDDPRLLGPCQVEGKTPALGIVVEIEEVFPHCAKAILRSRLWEPQNYLQRHELPSLGEILASLSLPNFDAHRYDQERAERYQRREGFY